jgi:hypothetical protein
MPEQGAGCFARTFDSGYVPLGQRLLRDNVPFKLPQCQFRSGTIYV